MPDVADLAHRMDESDRPRDAALASLAAKQHGVVGYRQLVELGIGRGAIERRLALGRLHRVHRGVFAVGHPRLVGPGRWMAAVLACGHAALLSHQSAAALWGFRPTAGTHVHVTTLRGRSVSRKGIRAHHTRRHHPDDRTMRDGIPVTTVARTLLDLAEALSPTRFQRAFEQADRSELIDMRAMDALIARSRGRHGLKDLATLIAGHRGPSPATRSELERSFLDLCRANRLPQPSVNVLVAGLEVDAPWLDQRLVVELDGYAYHHDRASFERDRARDAALQLAGHRVLRVTDRRIRSDPDGVVSAVRALLDQTGSSRRPVEGHRRA